MPSLVFDQRIDHFGGEGTFKQRYLYTTEFVKKQKPQVNEYKLSNIGLLVIIDVRGEVDLKEMHDFPMNVFDLGFRTESILAALEHRISQTPVNPDRAVSEFSSVSWRLIPGGRFYGQSFPSTSPTTNDLLKFLTVKQAIADLVSFREYLIKTYNLTGVKFILIGCSYAGSLAAWARVQHPDLFLGAVASCPVLDVKYEFVG
ncbi:hypothetical protein FOL47_001710, partial [Perkinsus chesapeaki]